MARLGEKVAIVTGGGTGIGRATAELFCTEGARVVITGRREQPLAETAEAIRGSGGQAHTVVADVSEPDACEEVVRAAREAFGPPTVLVNNAGIFELQGKLHETAVEHWDRTIAINLRGPYLMTRAVIPSMLETGGGSIVNVGSILSEVAIPGAVAYNSSKAGLLLLTRSTAMDYGADGIRCNMVGPGLVVTPMSEEILASKEMSEQMMRDYPIGRFGRPEDIAHAILHLASDESSWTTGSALMVDGGATAH